ncbi:hypothetical protein [Halobacillus amylolyticus]|uniref:Sporulation protein YjcZ n=1 Tax=Halobacillus amylolyticus TaxID=2932259 RepID=A0ABY4HFE4_9BACI|nr:hypothetical protein [Halobacillus amylolyticus]UOR13506.1 hypothetical protein MUO15_08645 [Halobacillus amylolyticus]
MSCSHIYNLCCRYEGRKVRIAGHDGRNHVGHITRVDRDRVWLRPEGNWGAFGYGAFGGYGGYGYGGYGYGGYGGYGYPIALGAIAGIALASAFFW